MKNTEEYEEFIIYAQAAFPDLGRLFDPPSDPVVQSRMHQWTTALEGVSFKDALEVIDGMVDGTITKPRFGLNDLARLPGLIASCIREKYASRWNDADDETRNDMRQRKTTTSVPPDIRRHVNTCRRLLRAARVESGNPTLDTKDVPAIQAYLDENMPV